VLFLFYLHFDLEEDPCGLDLEQNNVTFTISFPNPRQKAEWKADIEKCIANTRENMASKKISEPDRLPVIRTRILERVVQESATLDRMEVETHRAIEQVHELIEQERALAQTRDVESPVKTDGVRLRSYFHKRNQVLLQRREQHLTLISQYESQIHELERKIEQQSGALKDTKWLLEQCHQRMITCMGDDRFLEVFPLPISKRPKSLDDDKKSNLFSRLLTRRGVERPSSGDNSFDVNFSRVYDTGVPDGSSVEECCKLIKQTLPAERRSMYSSVDGFNVDDMDEEEPIAGVDEIDPEWDKIVLSPSSKLRRTISNLTAGSANALEAFLNATQNSYTTHRKVPNL
jgi:hypothetical protein